MISPAVLALCVGFYIFSTFADLSCATPIRRHSSYPWLNQGSGRPDSGQEVDAWARQDDRLGAVARMYHSGIGGGGFMLIRSPDDTYEFVDFRETAPAAAFQDMYNNNTDASIFGGLAR
ncbi:hypothetical protein CISG_06074 [Coccidioides immitis RMSCC 3703]|uniref:Uncharacterized protein n=1 Tax=Coccidioides immitis RMSCC 3703 TaxID=454286 RepID=A0A0J8QYV5_COCIT|nr:hypothetical protein CISG_06074 [Coccidioides immitis RMSCC 3703]